MSKEGACFDNGQRGDCGINCSEYLSGKCQIATEIISQFGTCEDDFIDYLNLYHQRTELTIKEPNLH